MKNENKIMVYDDACPLCSAYTKFFVKAGILTKEGRQCFTGIDSSLAENINMDKSRNEIPLINTKTGEVKYGIDAMTDVLADKWPFIKTASALKPVNWFLQRFYKLVSYNRRVVTATAFKGGNFDCTPDFNYKYRFTFMLFGLLMNSALLFCVHAEIFPKSVFGNTSLLELQLAHFALVTVNIFLAFSLPKQKAFEFLGQVNMLAILVNLFLLPLIFLNSFSISTPLLNNVLLAAITVIIIKQYIRRMKYAGTITNRFITGINIISIGCFIFYLIL